MPTPSKIKKRPARPEQKRGAPPTLGILNSFNSKPPPRMATSNKMPPKPNTSVFIDMLALPLVEGVPGCQIVHFGGRSFHWLSEERFTWPVQKRNLGHAH